MNCLTLKSHITQAFPSTLRKSLTAVLYIVLWLVLGLCSLHALALDTITATVDKNPAMADESITLTVVANDSMQRNDFDPSILENDFKVIRTSVSSQTQIINLTRSVTTTWTTILFPRRTGRLRIPAITINSISSDPIDVLVVPVSQQSQQETRDIFITAEVTPQDAYVQQQLTYTVKLHLAVELERGSLQVPTISGAVMEQLGEDSEATTIQNGKRYRVVTRQYSVIPQTSGELTLPSPIFEGNIRTRNRGSFGGLFNPSKPVNQIGPEVTISVLPIPEGFTGSWLPSEFVQINEEWSSALDQLTVGEPITRTITLSVLGVDEAVLPGFPDRLPPSIKAYPDQPQITSVNKDGTLIAQRVENIALVPSRAGTFVLPEISIPWFNTLTQQTEFAKLPAQSITVQPNTASSAPAQTPLPSQPSTAEPANVTEPTLKQSAEQTLSQVPENGSQQVWIWQILTAVLALAWAVHVWYLRKYSVTSASEQQSQAAHNAQKDNEKTVFKHLLDALKQQDSAQLDNLLKDWLNCWYPAQPRLAQYTQIICDQSFSEWVASYYESRYGSAESDQQAQVLRQQLTQWVVEHRKALQQKTAHHLQPLYPDT